MVWYRFGLKKSRREFRKNSAKKFASLNYSFYLCPIKTKKDMKKNSSKSCFGENTGSLTVNEPAVATAEVMELVMPDDIGYASIVDGVLQVTPDIEEEIAEVERGETVSMNEFKTMFAKWLD
jgi:hypothetical protein